jgi:hypothetical protein
MDSLKLRIFSYKNQMNIFLFISKRVIWLKFHEKLIFTNAAMKVTLTKKKQTSLKLLLKFCEIFSTKSVSDNDKTSSNVDKDWF